MDGSVGKSGLFKQEGLCSDSGTYANPGTILEVYSPSGEEVDMGLRTCWLVSLFSL